MTDRITVADIPMIAGHLGGAIVRGLLRSAGDVQKENAMATASKDVGATIWRLYGESLGFEATARLAEEVVRIATETFREGSARVRAMQQEKQEKL